MPLRQIKWTWFWLIPEDFCEVDKYVPVDMNKQVYKSRLLLV